MRLRSSQRREPVGSLSSISTKRRSLNQLARTSVGSWMSSKRLCRAALPGVCRSAAQKHDCPELPEGAGLVMGGSLVVSLYLSGRIDSRAGRVLLEAKLKAEAKSAAELISPTP